MVLFLCIQYFSVLCISVLVGDEVGSFLGRVIVATWLSMILCPFRRLALVLYMCTSVTLHVPPSYGRFISGITSVSSGVGWGSV